MAISLSIVGYFSFSPYKNVKENGFSFKYPKELNIVELGRGHTNKNTTNYIYYQIRNSEIEGRGGSVIQVTIPIKYILNEKYQRTLTSYLEASGNSEFIPLIKDININGHEGEIAEYRIDRQLPGDRPVHANYSDIYLESPYINAPVHLQYYQQDTDLHSLDEAWEMVLESIDY
ncbi:MAG: hypothetical protein U9P90_01920 [Patescibacteria group bacterium]|nr:hypothetical protein [Patescibacteria group bacterium]